jgi:hypothetical protein
MLLKTSPSMLSQNTEPHRHRRKRCGYPVSLVKEQMGSTQVGVDQISEDLAGVLEATGEYRSYSGRKNIDY